MEIILKEKLIAFWNDKKKRWIAITILAVLIITPIIIILTAPAIPAEIGKITRGDAIAAVYGTITVKPETEVLVKSRTSGVIREINVEQGQAVKKDALMAKITDEEQGTNLEEMKVELDAARQRQSIGSSAANELKSRRLELERITPLVRDGLIAPMELQRVQSIVEDLTRKVSQEIVELEQAVAVAQTKYDNARNQIDQGAIRSPIDGEVLEVFARLGEVVLNQSQLFVVGSKQTHLVAVVNEEDVGAIEEGMTASVRLYSFGNRDFTAKVMRKMNRGINQSFEVILKLESDSPVELFTGMTGEANIVIGKRENTLLVPTRALRDGNLLYVLRGGKVRLQRVQTGYRNIEVCEITDGVNEGETIILSEHDRYKEGDRVKSL
ncbi:MAG: efflux RND transporter periplasmic adaptor subunit [Candidatus Methylacidiphilales bacterium]